MKDKRWARLAAALYVAAALLAVPKAAAQDGGVRVVLNGQELQFDTSAVLRNGAAYVPLRAFAEAVSPAEVGWDAGQRAAVVRAPGLNLEVREGREYMLANDRCFYLPGAALKKDGRLLLPVRALSAVYGLEVEWSAASRTVFLQGAGKPLVSGGQVYDAEALYWLARIIHAESQGEPLAGKIAVGNVVLNRVRSADFPETVYRVIFDRRNGVQFTPTADGSIYNTPGEDSVMAAKMCFEGAAAVPAGCLYFLNADIAASLWVPQNRPYVTAIGGHQFYA